MKKILARKLAFVIRIKGTRGANQKINQILSYFRLRNANYGIFIKLNESRLKMLKLVEQYVTWGYPDLKSVRDLITKRGHTVVEGLRVPLTDNKIIENNFNDPEIICTEDLVHQIYTCGPHFNKVNLFLSPFKLTPPRGGFEARFTNFEEGGHNGNRQDRINQLINVMN